LALAELEFCFENEMMLKPMDFLSRRTGRLYFDIESIESIKKLVLAFFAKKLNWTALQTKKELTIINKALKQASFFSTD